jgi:hypothetical protein
MNSGSHDDSLYEVHTAGTDGDRWQHAGGFDSLEDARVQAVHLIRDTDAARVRVIHIVDYYAKAADAAE